MEIYGLLGKSLGHSFSKQFFSKKFHRLGLTDRSYNNFELNDIRQFKTLLQQNQAIRGLNVTIPYKEAILPYLDELSEEAQQIGAVNCIQFRRSHNDSVQLVGHNTDHYGFKQSLLPLLSGRQGVKALILGSGGAAKAIIYALNTLGIPHLKVSRTGSFTYQQIDSAILQQYQLIINTTPLGTYPNINERPPLPYHLITSEHIGFDLVYNPDQTAFLSAFQERNGAYKNGLEMLQLQAEKSWEIWNS